MNNEQKSKEDLEATKGWLAIAKEDNNTMAIQNLGSHFRELKKSENEMIRKEIISYIEKNILFDSVDEEIPTLRTYITWLEKQGKIVDEYEDKLDRCACESFDKGYKAALEKQGEQKPSWSEEDDIHLTNAILAAEKEWGCKSCTAKWLRTLKNKIQEMQIH